MQARIRTLFLIAAAAALGLFAVGCGGGGGTAALTVSGAVRTPGGTAAGRQAALSNVDAAVAVEIVYVQANGARTVIAADATTASGQFNIPLPAGYSYTTHLLEARATVGGAVIRGFVYAGADIDVSPITEAAVQLVEEELAASGEDYSVLTRARVEAVTQSTAQALAGADFSGAASVSEAVAAAKTEASRNSDVADSIAGAVTPGASTRTVWLAAVTTSDFQSGALALMALTPNPAQQAPTVASNALPVHSDAVVQAYDGNLFVTNRFGADNVHVVKPTAADAVTEVLPQFSVGANSNPYGLIFVNSNKAYMLRYGATELYVVDPAVGLAQDVTPTTIDLGDFAVEDGIPEMATGLVVGDKAFVALQNLANWAPTGHSRVVVIDTVTDTIIDVDPDTDGTQAIELVCQNPSSMAYGEATGRIFVSCSGSWADDSAPGGVDVIDPGTYAVSNLIPKSDFDNREPGAIAIQSSTRGYIVVVDGWADNSVLAFNPSTGAVGDQVYSTEHFIADMALDPYGYLLICDTNFAAPGVIFIDTATNQQAAGPISTGLPPQNLAFVQVTVEID